MQQTLDEYKEREPVLVARVRTPPSALSRKPEAKTAKGQLIAMFTGPMQNNYVPCVCRKWVQIVTGRWHGRGRCWAPSIRSHITTTADGRKFGAQRPAKHLLASRLSGLSLEEYVAGAVYRQINYILLLIFLSCTHAQSCGAHVWLMRG